METASDGVGYKRSPLLRQQPQHLLFCRHQCIYPRRLKIKEVSDCALGRKRGNQYFLFCYLLGVQRRYSTRIGYLGAYKSAICQIRFARSWWLGMS